MSKDSTQRPRPDSNRGPFDPKSDAVTDWPLRLLGLPFLTSSARVSKKKKKKEEEEEERKKEKHARTCRKGALGDPGPEYM